MPSLGAPWLHRERFWIALPAVVLILADAVVTLGLRPASYWGGLFTDRVEQGPLGAAALTAHPTVFILRMVAWLTLAIRLVWRLPPPWHRALALAVVVGRTAGPYGRAAPRNYWTMVPIFLPVGNLTALAWQRAETADAP